MGQTTAELLDLIEARRAELGWSQVDVGRHAFGKADNSVISNMKRGSSPTFDRLAAICDALGLELYIGKPRRPEGSPLQLDEDGPDTDLQKSDAFRAGYLPLPWLDGSKGAGSSPVAFAYAWLDSNGLIPENLVCLLPDSVAVAGMKASKLLAVLDRTAGKTGYGLWAIRENAKNCIARVMFEGSNLILMGEDLDHPPRIIPNWQQASVTPLGKVAWIGYRPGA